MLRLSALLFLTTASSLSAQEVRLEELTGGLEQPVYITHSGDGSGRLFIVEQAGRIRIFRDGRLLPTPFLDIRGAVRSGGERGLLGLAFHPEFASNRRFFVNYTRTSDAQLQTVIAEFRAAESNPDVAEPQGEVLLTYDQPFNNHNGGYITFGPDGCLYISSGDGGSGGDPLGNGQRLGTLLGKILRINVDEPGAYSVPPDNPFLTAPGARREIWAYGLRNPWRFSFDRQGGRLFAADVGQVTWEEVNLIERGGNYGWNETEGPDCYPPSGPQNCDRSGLTAPISFYGRDEGLSVTGGYVYRGPSRTPLWGSYIFGDFVTGNVWALRQDAAGEWQRRLLLATGRNISSFGEDEAGNLYLVDYAGRILRFRFTQTEEVRAYAQLALGGGFRDVLLVGNRGQGNWEGRLLLRQGNGEAWDTPWSLNGEDRTGESEITVQLGPFSSVRLRLDGDAEARAGYLWIDPADGSDLDRLAVSFFYNFSNAAGLVDSTAALASTLSSEYRFPVERSPGVDTGVAVAPFPGLEPAQLLFTLYDSQGEVIDSVQRPFEGHRAEFFSQIFAGLPQEFVGLIEIRADLPVAVTVLRQELTPDGFQLTTIPAEE